MIINITSTGDLDCEALATKVVNATAAALDLSGYGGRDNFICNSKKANVTTFQAIPWPTGHHNEGNAIGIPWGLIVLVGLAGWFGCIL